jgi:hypothetical protein
MIPFAQDDSPDPSPVRFREALSPNISRVPELLDVALLACYDKAGLVL